MSKRMFIVLAVAIIGLYACVGWLIAQQARPGVVMAGLPTQPFSHVVTKQLTVQTGGTTLQSNVDATGYDFTMDDVTADDVTAQRAVITDTLSAAGITGPITSTQVILGGTFTAFRNGVSASVTDGMTVTHSLGAAPEFVIPVAYGDGVTVTVGIAVSDTTSFTYDVPDGVTIANVIWFAGK